MTDADEYELGNRREGNNGANMPRRFPKPTPSSCQDFEDILMSIGGEEKYQKLLLYGFLAPLLTLSPFLNSSSFFLFDVPEHWCHVPGKSPDISVEQWKNSTIPLEIGPEGSPRYSKCEMRDKVSVVPCQHGWEYDKTYYESTIASDYNWVCSQSNIVANILSLNTAGAAVGTITFGILADNASVLFLLFRGAALFISNTLAVQGAWFASSLMLSGVNGIPVMWVAEICGTDYRSWIYSFTWMVYVFGNCLLPLTIWMIRRWFIFSLVALLPFALLLPISFLFLPESPRWLATVGKEEEVLRIVTSISKMNRKKENGEELRRMVGDLIMFGQMRNVQDGESWRNILKKKRIGLHTLLLILALSMNKLLYNGITLNSLSTGGNKFINYFLLSIIELPAGLCANYLVEKTGRRWTQPAFFFVSLISCIFSCFFIFYPSLSYVVTIGAVGVKMGVSVSLVVVYLQTTELFPTQLRSTGGGLVSTGSSLILMASPYIVFTGNENVVIPYILFSLISIIGMVASSFLPETLYHTLPQSVDDANEFGGDKKFWSYLPEDVKKIKWERETMKVRTVIRSSVRRSVVPHLHENE